MNPLIARLLAGLFIGAALLGTAGAQAAPKASPMQRACEQIGGRLQSVGVKNCLAAGLTASSVRSVKNVPLLYRDYIPAPGGASGAASEGSEPPKRVMMIGGIHGDELSSVSITFKWMQKLEQERLQPFQWRVIPCANPDGLLIRPSMRTNASGVDLNRNFPTDDWEATALNYWKKKTKSDKRRYPGKKALSEPETRWLTEQIKEFKPDAIVSIHAPFGVLDYDGPREPPQKFGYLRLQLLGTYPGSLGNYAGVSLKVPVITLELPHAGIMPTAMQTQRIWGDMLTWLEENLPRPVPADAANVSLKKNLMREAP